MENGRVSFEGDAGAVSRANVFLRTAERVLLKVGSFKAVTFDELFEKTRALAWEDYLPKDAKCWVKKASSINSKPVGYPADHEKGDCGAHAVNIRDGEDAGDGKRIPAARLFP